MEMVIVLGVVALVLMAVGFLSLFLLKNVTNFSMSAGILLALTIFPSQMGVFGEVSYLDPVSKMMMMLVLWLTFSMNLTLNLSGMKKMLINSLALICLVFFTSKTLLMMFIFFEFSIIPIFILIMGWGIQPERVSAGFYMFMYTLLCSAPLFLSTLYFSFFWKSSFILTSSGGEILEKTDFWLVLFFNLGFMSKIPVFLAHIWLPKAHVEATLEGSMFLAGVLLKLGVFGLLRILPFSLSSGKDIMTLFFCLGLIGGGLSSLTATSCDDVKMIVAYASISHMNLIVSSILSFKLSGTWSAVIVSISHGMASSYLFFIITLVYSKSGTRSVVLNKGLSSNSFLSSMLLVGWVVNISIPPLLSFWGELFAIMSIVSFFLESSVVLGVYFVASSFYSMFNYGVLSHSPHHIFLKNSGVAMKDLTGLSFLILPLILFYFNFSIC